MAYSGKTNWQNNEIVEASDMNRIEQGISDVDVELGNVQTALDGKVDNSRVLTNVPANAKFTDTVYTHPSTHPASMITEDETHRFVSDTEKMAWNSAESNAKTYADNNFEQIDSNIMRKNGAQTMTANLIANGGTDYSTSKVRNIIAIEEGTTEPTAENGALLIIYEAGE